MKKKAVILLSGGLDSTTCLALAGKEDFELFALTINYGQRHNFELKASKLIASLYNVKKHSIIDINLAEFGGSALTDDIEVPKNRSENEMSNIPITYVPARNTIFLSIALAWAESLKAHHIFIGVNSLDYSGYPDCRPEFIKSFETTANLATKIGVEGEKISIHTPLINLTKGEIIKLGLSLGVNYGLTSTCYDPKKNGNPCGSCDACLLRIKGFNSIFENDPLDYKN
jgi:7-cyano-7-deazaguanine synthase